MQRRLKDAVVALTAETIKARESSDAAARKLERLTRWLIGFTATLVILILAVVILTAVLAAEHSARPESARLGPWHEMKG
jgi:hypothetical protein